MLYISYYSKQHPDHVKRYSISIGDPKFPSRIDRKIRELCPKWSMVNGTRQGGVAGLKYWENEYPKLYEEICVNAKPVIESLLEEAKTTDIVLLCFEKDKRSCHRYMLAQFIERVYNVKVPEWRDQQLDPNGSFDF